MIYFYYGNESMQARARARAVIAVLKQKRPDAEYFRITAENWTPETLELLLGGQGLFEQKCIVLLDGVCESSDAKSWIVAHAERFKQSNNAFVLIERAVDVATSKVLQKVAQEVKVFELVSKNPFQGKGTSTFALADALGERNGKKLWGLLNEFRMDGSVPEEMSGVLVWQVRSMLLAQNAPNAGASGLKPFVYTKSKKFAEHYSRQELVELSEKLVAMYHDAHRGRVDFSLALERFALSL